MDGVPVANHDENQQQEGNQQQAGGLGGINRKPRPLGRGIVASSIDHGLYCTLRGTVGDLDATLRAVSYYPLF
jgi:hypothetical protein